MAATFKAASRYSSYDSRSSTSSSTELKQKVGKSPALAPPASSSSASASSRALVRTKASDLASGAKNQNFADMVKRFMGKKSSAASRGKLGSTNLVIPVDVIAEDLKKGAKSRNQLGVLPKKLFGGGLEKKVKKESVKALTEVKGGGNNARTLAMVLRSERELLSANKELEMEVAELKLVLEQKNREVSLCLLVFFVSAIDYSFFFFFHGTFLDAETSSILILIILDLIRRKDIFFFVCDWNFLLN